MSREPGKITPLEWIAIAIVAAILLSLCSCHSILNVSAAAIWYAICVVLSVEFVIRVIKFIFKPRKK